MRLERRVCLRHVGGWSRQFFFWQSNGKKMGRGRDDSLHSSRMEMLVVDSSATSMCIFPSRPIILALRPLCELL